MIENLERELDWVLNKNWECEDDGIIQITHDGAQYVGKASHDAEVEE
jgi:hypothetical protein